MRCPFCGSYQTIVLDSRQHEQFNRRYRRYYCSDCGKRFTSYEVTKEELERAVEKQGQLFSQIIELALEGGGVQGRMYE